MYTTFQCKYLRGNYLEPFKLVLHTKSRHASIYLNMISSLVDLFFLSRDQIWICLVRLELACYSRFCKHRVWVLEKKHFDRNLPDCGWGWGRGGRRGRGPFRKGGRGRRDHFLVRFLTAPLLIRFHFLQSKTGCFYREKINTDFQSTHCSNCGSLL